MNEYIEQRRKQLGKRKEDVAQAMGISPRTYKRNMDDGTFTIDQVIKASILLEFDLVALPKEGKFTKF